MWFGARPVLKKCMFRNSRQSSDSHMFGCVHEFLHAEMSRPELLPHVRHVIPGGWLKRHSQHMACELRRWRGRGAGRKNCQDGRALRKQRREERLRRNYRKLGFNRMPACCKNRDPAVCSLWHGAGVTITNLSQELPTRRAHEASKLLQASDSEQEFVLLI